MEVDVSFYAFIKILQITPNYRGKTKVYTKCILHAILYDSSLCSNSIHVAANATKKNKH
jgi:hypothetical protein